MKAGDCVAAPDVNAIWIEALEWVLGDEAHRAAYDDWLRHIQPGEEHADVKMLSAREVGLRDSLLMALERLR